MPDSSSTRRRPSSKALVGSFRPHPRGFGFVELDSPTQSRFGPLDSVFVPPTLVEGFISDDVVEVEVVEGRDGRAAAGALRLISRPRRLLAGTVEREGDAFVLVPFPSLGRDPWPFAAGSADLVGQVVVCPIVADSPSPALGSPIVGPFAPSSPRAAQVLAVLRALGTPSVPPPSAAELSEALHEDVVTVLSGAELPYPALPPPSSSLGSGSPGSAGSRRDRTAAPVFTVDGVSSRDLDDAISVTETPGGLRVEVHIADVAAAVPQGSDLDRWALARGASLYLASGNFPMLPRSLSEGELSLLPGVLRRTVTAAFTVPISGPDAGAVTDVEVFRSTISSRARLSYQDVESFISASAPAATRPPSESLRLAWRAAKLLSSRRALRPTLEGLFSGPAWEVSLDSSGCPTRRPADQSPHAQTLVEALMVAANEAVAAWLVANGSFTLFRNHAGVDPEATWLLSQVADVSAASTGAQFPAPAFSSEGLLEVLADLEGSDPNRHATLQALLTSSMLRAEYFAAPGDHFGLGVSPYCHFTSPIRRFADLVTHRMVAAVLDGAPAPYSQAELAEVASYLNGRMSALGWAEAAERSALWSLLLAAECERGRLVSEATVQSVSRQGASVRLSEFGVSAFLPSSKLGRGWSPSPDGLWGSSERLHLRVGARLPVRVTGSEVPAGRVLLAPAT